MSLVDGYLQPSTKSYHSLFDLQARKSTWNGPNISLAIGVVKPSNSGAFDTDY